MAKKKISKKAKFRLATFGLVAMVFIVYFFYTLFMSTYHLISLRQEEQMLRENLDYLIQEQQFLKTEINKLQDPNYVASYARENYQYSREGEFIIRMTEEEEVIEEEANKNNYTWLYVVSGSLIMLFIIKKYRR